MSNLTTHREAAVTTTTWSLAVQHVRAWASGYRVIYLVGLLTPLAAFLYLAHFDPGGLSLLGPAWIAASVPLYLLGTALASTETPALIAAGATRDSVSRAVLVASLCLGVASVVIYVPFKLLMGDVVPWYQVAIPLISCFLSVPSAQTMTLIATRWGFRGGLITSFLTMPLLQTVLLPVLGSPKVFSTPVSPWVLIAPWGLSLLVLSLVWWPRRLRTTIHHGAQS